MKKERTLGPVSLLLAASGRRTSDALTLTVSEQLRAAKLQRLKVGGGGSSQSETCSHASAYELQPAIKDGGASSTGTCGGLPKYLAPGEETAVDPPA